MTISEKLALLEDIFEVDPGKLKENVELGSLENWDSMAMLSLIVLMDDKFKKKLNRDKINEFKIVKDILNYMEE